MSMIRPGWLMSLLWALVALPALAQSYPSKPLKMIVPFSAGGSSDVLARGVAELVALAKSKPGTLTFASAGNGTASHLSGELFKAAAGIDIVHIPYKGGGAATPDLMSGQVSMMIETITNALSMVKSGKLRAL